jgi:putative hydrolase of the HAD superfamily
MERPWPEVVLFDVFGTLVTYEADRTVIAYERTHTHLVDRGATFAHDGFVAAWDRASQRVESANDESLVEHSMRDVAHAFLADVGLDLDPPSVDLLIETFLAEWIVPVALVPGADQLVHELAAHHRLGVVSNTNDSSMVPTLLASFGIADCFEHIVLSVDHGHRKPHPSIYAAALDLFGVAPAEAAFVGDTFEADYVGPTEAGVTAYLIDPERRHGVPDQNRLGTALDLRARLGFPWTGWRLSRR